MSKYSMRIKEILENYYLIENSIVEDDNFEETDLTSGEWVNKFDTAYESPFDKTYPSADTIIEYEWNKLFDFDFPKLPDYEDGQLEKKIIKAYYMREIGFETVGRFKLALNEMLNRIMPYYIELYESIAFNKIDPLVNVDLYDDSTRNTDNQTTGTTNTNSTTTGENKQIYEDTPSNELSPDTNYATTITKTSGESTDTGTNTSSGTSDTTDVYSRHLRGIQGYNKQDLLARYRENIINVDELIILELRDLFMLLY